MSATTTVTEFIEELTRIESEIRLLQDDRKALIGFVALTLGPPPFLNGSGLNVQFRDRKLLILPKEVCGGHGLDIVVAREIVHRIHL